MTPVRLSICIATFARARFIGQTLEAILGQVPEGVEVIVLDGASPDDTPAVVGAFLGAHPCLSYHRGAVNAGVDRDFDTVVGYARGQYCWLMSDDDLLVPGAVAQVLERLADGPDLVVVDAQMRDRDLSVVLRASQLNLSADVEFGPGDSERFFVKAAGYLSFIGSVVIRREAWLARPRAPYYDTMFIHIGVIFQLPALRRVKLMAEPLIQIRTGNASWTGRTFEIWTAKWPRLIWSFGHFSEAARREVTERYPAANWKILLWHRGAGSYGTAQSGGSKDDPDAPRHPLARLIARVPARPLNALLALFCVSTFGRDGPMRLYQLACANCSSTLARWLARRYIFATRRP